MSADASLMQSENTTTHDALRLAGYSFLILFFELAFIRYVPAHVRIVGFYVNFVLIATFLGMSLGLLRARDAARLRWMGLPAFLALLVAVKYFSIIGIEPAQDPSHVVWGGAIDISPNVTRIGVVPVALLIFVLCSAVFVPLGALLGQAFRKFKPLTAYSIDIAGSLLGIITFALLSWTRTAPTTWFALGFLVWLALSFDSRRFVVALVPAAVAALAIVVWTSGPWLEYWSPYYRVSVLRSTHRYVLRVNGSFHQYVADLDPTGAVPDERMVRLRRDYLRPLEFIDRLDTTLVVGAGAGNDVVALLQAGAGHVDAVEIDPVILDIGRAMHFQQPYSDPRVRAITNDARAYLRNTDQRYDVILMGTLDSHTALAGMGSLRLDNYVYTREAFQSAADHLKPGGTLIAYHMSLEPFIIGKIRQMLADTFGEEPVMFYDPDPAFFNMTFLAGNVPDSVISDATVPEAVYSPTVTPVDDWPYLYLSHRTVPRHYFVLLGGVLAIALVSIALTARTSLSKGRGGFDALMFFMGAGFLLVETKSVTEMSLLFGSTWLVNVLVFASILVVILLANLWVGTRPPRATGPVFAALFGALALAYLVPIRDLLWLGTVGKWLLGGFMVALPILFAAMIFANAFRGRTDASRALAFNVMGAVVGGVLEYSSMLVGIKALYLVGAVIYLCAWLATRVEFGAAAERAAPPEIVASTSTA